MAEPTPLLAVDVGHLEPAHTEPARPNALARQMVGGFVIGAVSVELAAGDQTRRVAVRPDSPTFVIAVGVGDNQDMDAIDVRALDRNGAVVDSSAAWRAEDEAAQPGISVAQALALPNGSRATVRGLLLALPRQAPLLCDDIADGAGVPWRRSSH